mmetsp:Transcript_20807/g.35021  ORF Transcript_20807/g.35021 Transcript_20807/m.35021 type:complete len:323 (+) Transcript_20807:238-1206(+)
MPGFFATRKACTDSSWSRRLLSCAVSWPCLCCAASTFFATSARFQPVRCRSASSKCSRATFCMSTHLSSSSALSTARRQSSVTTASGKELFWCTLSAAAWHARPAASKALATDGSSIRPSTEAVSFASAAREMAARHSSVAAPASAFCCSTRCHPLVTRLSAASILPPTLSNAARASNTPLPPPPSSPAASKGSERMSRTLRSPSSASLHPWATSGQFTIPAAPPTPYNNNNTTQHHDNNTTTQRHDDNATANATANIPPPNAMTTTPPPRPWQNNQPKNNTSTIKSTTATKQLSSGVMATTPITKNITTNAVTATTKPTTL